MKNRAVDNSELARWRAMPSLAVLKVIAEHIKQDPDFVPLSDRNTSRWHVCVDGRDYELLCTGPKFYDTHEMRGGGGAIDLVMHLCQLDFKGAVARLRTAL